MKSNKRGRPSGMTVSKNLDLNSLGYLIQSNRIKKGLGLKEFSAEVGVSFQFLSNLEHNTTTIPWHFLLKIAEVLDIPKDHLALINLKNTHSYKQWEQITDNLHA